MIIIELAFACKNLHNHQILLGIDKPERAELAKFSLHANSFVCRVYTLQLPTTVSHLNVQAHRTSSNLLEPHYCRYSKVCRVLSHEFWVIRLYPSLSHLASSINLFFLVQIMHCIQNNARYHDNNLRDECGVCDDVTG